jgi:hypothetical protein
MRIIVMMAAILAVVAVTTQPTVAIESGGNLTIKTKSSPPRAPIEEKVKQPKSKKQVKTRQKVPPVGCGPTMPGKPSTSTC